MGSQNACLRFLLTYGPTKEDRWWSCAAAWDTPRPIWWGPAVGLEQHYLGPLNGPELLVVLPEAKAVGSVAMSMLGSDADLGVVLFTSRDASHYQQGQGTQLLHEIALMLPELLERWIERV